jgi:hypothetical protein
MLRVPTTPEEESVHVQPSDQQRELVFNSELMQEIEREIAAEPRGSDEVSSDSDGAHCNRLNEGNIFDLTVSGISRNTTEQSAQNSELELNTEIESQTPENV